MSTVLKEVLTNTYKKEMISWMENHPEDFEQLVSIALSDDQKYAWRAAWLLWSCITESDPRLKGRTKDFVDVLPKKPGSHQREFLILLSKMDIETDLAGDLFEHCVRIWTNSGLQASLRYNAFKLMTGIARSYPELTNELQLLMEEEFLLGLSDNVRKSVFRLVEELE